MDVFVVFRTSRLVSCRLCIGSGSRNGDWANVSGTVKSHVDDFPCDQWISVAPSGRLPSVLDSPTGSLHARTCALSMTLRRMSSIKDCLTCRGALILHDRPWRPLASTWDPHTHWWGWQMEVPSRYLTATRISSADSLTLTEANGGAFIQSPAWGALAALSLVCSVTPLYLDRISSYTDVATAVSQTFWKRLAGSDGIFAFERLFQETMASLV